MIGTRSPIRLGYHYAKGAAAAIRYGFPGRKLTVIGITGTDGKTTTVGMTAHILHETGYSVGALSTAFFRVKDKIEWNETQKTSPSPFVVQKFLRRLVNEGCTHAVVEYSSHGLVQHRTLWTSPDVAAITNISAEHLDYHGSMEQYIEDKGKLFHMLKKDGTKVLNADDRTYASYISIPTGDTVTYSPTEQADLWLSDKESTPQESNATVHVGETNITAQLHLTVPGEFQLENALCAIACAQSVGVELHKAAESLESFTGAPGRMERIDEGQPFSVFVDFTVTPGAYQKTLSAARSMLPEGKRLLVLTGSCGDRMKEKRPEVGRICSELADVVVVSNEDPYTEDPMRIIEEVWEGVDQAKTEAHKIPDRKEAIEYLLKHAEAGDIVLFCGKGSDTTMWLKDGQVPWNEREIVREVIHHS